MITQDELKRYLNYDLKTGLFTWNFNHLYNAKKGEIAGSPDNNGYIMITINGKRERAHRLAFLYVEGYIPKQVDHNNGVKNDNRWHNLNSSSNQHNRKNMPKRKDNKSGYVGVFFDEKQYVWISYIHNSGKRIHIGSFFYKKDAIKARKDAEIKYGFNPNHGRNV